MKKIAFLLILLSLWVLGINAQNVAINDDGAAPNASAMLDVQSTSKGFLAPCMTQAQRLLIQDPSTEKPATGLLVYQTNETAGYYYYNGTSWIQIGSASDATQWTTNSSDIYYNSGNVGIGTTSPGHKLTVEAAGTSNTSVLAIDVTGSGTFTWASSAIASGLTANQNIIHMIGKSESEYNCGYIGFNLQESGSSENFLTFGLHIHDNLLNLTGAGNVGIGTTSPNRKLHISGSNDAGLRIENTINDNAGDFYLYTSSLGGFNIWDEDASLDRLRIDGNGNVGIGTTSPAAKLDVQASGSGSTGGIRLRGHTTSTDISYWSEGQFAMMLGGVYKNVISSNGVSYFNGGNVGIGTTNPGSYKLYVNGSAGGTTAWTNTSDARLKKDVQPIDNGLSKVMQLRPVTFNWKQEEYPDKNFDNRNHIGFIAQEVEGVIPQVVTTAGDEMQTKSIAYSDLVPMLTKAIQEQQKQIEELKAQNAALTKKTEAIDQLSAEVENLKILVNNSNNQLTDNK